MKCDPRLPTYACRAVVASMLTLMLLGCGDAAETEYVAVVDRPSLGEVMGREFAIGDAEWIEQVALAETDQARWQILSTLVRADLERYDEESSDEKVADVFKYQLTSGTNAGWFYLHQFPGITRYLTFTPDDLDHFADGIGVHGRRITSPPADIATRHQFSVRALELLTGDVFESKQAYESWRNGRDIKWNQKFGAFVECD